MNDITVKTADCETRCPVCNSTQNSVTIEARDGIKLLKCASCGLAFHNELYSPAEQEEYYGHYYHEWNLSFSPINDVRFKELLATFEAHRSSNRILDIGCGSGQLLKVAIEQGWTAYGTEIASGVFEHLSGLGIDAFGGELQEANYPSRFFDVIYCSEVIEHMVDPCSLVREVSRILRPGGLLYLTTPNYGSLTRRLLGAKWRAIGREHICYFTPKVLAGMLKGSNFRKVETSTRNIDPHEIRKLFGRPSSSPEPETGFAIERTDALRGRFESNRMLRLVKKLVNAILFATSMGDTICVRAER